jgi:hypothetical protein
MCTYVLEFYHTYAFGISTQAITENNPQVSIN